VIAVWTSLVAVLGTLAAGMVQGRLARTSQRLALRETRRAERWNAALTAVTQLLAALAQHRRAMWVLEDHRLAKAPREVVEQARAISHDTRDGIEIPLHTVAILVPALVRPAETAMHATFAMRNAADDDRTTLNTRRQLAVDTHRQLVAAAREVFADPSDFVTASRKTRNKAVAVGRAVTS
jgi:hypothetical protein